MYVKLSRTSILLGAAALCAAAASAFGARALWLPRKRTRGAARASTGVRMQVNPWRAWLAACAAVVCAALILASAAWAYWSMEKRRHRVAQAITGGELSRAPGHFRRYGCAGCHRIPGIAGADGKVGGRLEDLRGRVYIGGATLNTPEAIIRWIVAPQTFAPHSAMPVTGINEAEARDVAAYLYAQ